MQHGRVWHLLVWTSAFGNRLYESKRCPKVIELPFEVIKAAIPHFLSVSVLDCKTDSCTLKNEKGWASFPIDCSRYSCCVWEYIVKVFSIMLTFRCLLSSSWWSDALFSFDIPCRLLGPPWGWAYLSLVEKLDVPARSSLRCRVYPVPIAFQHI